jgi:hypothetical protein
VQFGYSKGILPSRRLEKLSRENITAMALSGEGADHTTIAKFISGSGERRKGLFSEVLLYCRESGLIGGELFAIDDCRLPPNAAKEWSGTRDKLAAKKKKFEEYVEKLLAAHKKLDQNENGNKYPGEGRARTKKLWRSSERKRRTSAKSSNRRDARNA